jgi:hypothetical protein
MRRLGLMSSMPRFVPCTSDLTSPATSLCTLPGLLNGSTKALKDSVSEIKSITSSLLKCLGHIENDLVPSILEDVKSLELKIEGLINEVNDLKEDNGSMLGTLQAQDEDLTVLENHLANIEPLWNSRRRVETRVQVASNRRELAQGLWMKVAKRKALQ